MRVSERMIFYESEERFLLGLDLVLHDAHLINVPVHEPILDVLDHVRRLWSIQLTVLLTLGLLRLLCP